MQDDPLSYCVAIGGADLCAPNLANLADAEYVMQGGFLHIKANASSCLGAELASDGCRRPP